MKSRRAMAERVLPPARYYVEVTKVSPWVSGVTGYTGSKIQVDVLGTGYTLTDIKVDNRPNAAWRWDRVGTPVLRGRYIVDVTVETFGSHTRNRIVKWLAEAPR